MKELTREQIKELSDEQIQTMLLSAKRRRAFWAGVEYLMALTILLPFTLLSLFSWLLDTIVEYFPLLKFCKKISEKIEEFLEWVVKPLRRIKFLTYPSKAWSSANYMIVRFNSEISFRIHGEYYW